MDNESTARLHRAAFGLAASILCVSIAGADPLDPNGFASLGNFPTTPGVYAINSDNVTIVGPTGTINGVVFNGIAVFTFQTIQIGNGVTVNGLVGARPVALLSRTDINVIGTGVINFSAGVGPTSGAGGGAGGRVVEPAYR